MKKNNYKIPKQMKSIAFSLISLGLLTACSSELVETANDITGDEVQKVTVQSHPFEFDDDTRTLLTASYKSINFSWASYDAMGVFPVAPYSNSQAKRTLSVPAGADAHYATFDGAGWELSQNNTYAAYVPYNGSLPSSTEYDEVPIDLTGQDGTLETIGKKCDYMYAPSTRGTFKNLGGNNTEIVFDFQHAVSILQLMLTMPVATDWRSVTLASTDGSKVWITSATMNVATGEVTPKETASEVTLSLDNVSTTTSNNTLTLYLAVLPTTTGDLTLTANTSANKSYTATLKGKAFKAGKAYRLSASLSPVFTQTGYKDGYAYVDLNLPSRLKWATMNVGATSVTDYGKYYAWGETKGYGEEDPSNSRNYDRNSKNSYVKTYYGWDTYKWCNGSWYPMTKYCTDSEYGTVDNKTTLEPEDDAATQNWGGAWRMPTLEEQNELVNNCYLVWTESYNDSGVAGYIVYAAKSPSDKGRAVYKGKTPSSDYSLSDSHIFLPAAGYVSDDKSYSVRRVGGYWSTSLCEVDYIFHKTENYFACHMYFDPIFCNQEGLVTRRCDGRSVRAVCE